MEYLLTPNTQYAKLSPGNYATAFGGCNSEISAGDYSNIYANDYSHLNGGEWCSLYGGLDCTFSAGLNSTFIGKWHDSRKIRTAVAYVGENGIEPNIPYKINKGDWVKV